MYKCVKYEGKQYYGKQMLLHLTECNDSFANNSLN